MAGILDVFSRRNLLLGLGGAAAVGAATAGSAGRAFAQVLGRPTQNDRRVALRSAGYADWVAQLGTYFTTQSGHVLRLAEVQPLPRRSIRASNLRDPGFIASFDISRGSALGEGLYLVAHPTGGTFEIFMTKAGPKKPLRMIAVFN